MGILEGNREAHDDSSLCFQRGDSASFGLLQIFEVM